MIKHFSKFLKRLDEKEFNIFNAVFEDNKFVFEKMFIEDNCSKVIIVYGDNASGKSLFASILQVILRKNNVHVRNACMSNRTASGMQRAMIFGDESDQSTGDTSVNVARKCLESTLSDSNGVAMLDEPDIGLSNRYQHAFGKYIAEKAKSFNDHGLVLVSHNEILINSFLVNYESNVSFIGVNTDLNYFEWLKNQSPASVEELLGLHDYAMDKWRAIHKTFEKR